MIAQLTELWEFLKPFAPYIGVIFLVDQTMRHGIKPLFKSQRDPKTNTFKSRKWYYARRTMFAHPAILGMGIGAISTAAGFPANLYVCFLCGAAAQMIILGARDFAKSKGYKVPDDAVAAPFQPPVGPS